MTSWLGIGDASTYDWGRKFDLIVADPPYNIGIEYDGPCKDDRPEAVFEAWMQAWLWNAFKHLADRGSMWVVINHENADTVYRTLHRECGLEWRNTVTWYESFGTQTEGKFARRSRQLMYFRQRAGGVWNPPMTLSARQLIYGDRRAKAEGCVMGDVWTDIPRVCGTHSERVPGVPTQLPERLVLRMVRATSNPGDAVLDPFVGSGTTGVVCRREGRGFWGLDLSAKYVNIARGRIHCTPETPYEE